MKHHRAPAPVDSLANTAIRSIIADLVLRDPDDYHDQHPESFVYHLPPIISYVDASAVCDAVQKWFPARDVMLEYPSAFAAGQAKIAKLFVR